jgi:hypothetical protein
MIGTPASIEFLSERHELGLFTVEEYLGAFTAAGLAASWDERGLMGRGLVVGVKALEGNHGQQPDPRKFG